MPATDPKLLRSLNAKLTRLMRCVIAKAGDDPDFAQQLGDVLRGNRRDGSRSEEPAPPKRKHFNPVTFLHENGPERLRAQLGYKTDSELRDIIRGEGIVKGKEVNTLERDKMIDDIIAHADRRLHQGSSFLAPTNRAKQ
jgi:hypothetical protein